jgi:hypothetical protein
MARVNDLVPPVAAFLVAKAKKRQRTTYGQVADAVGTHPRVVPKVLEILRARCLQSDWPALTAIVVSSTTGRPGEAFLDPWLPRDASEVQKREMAARMTTDVNDFDWFPLLKAYGVTESGNSGAAAPETVTFRVWYQDGAFQLSTPDGFRTAVVDQPGSDRHHRELFSVLTKALNLSER